MGLASQADAREALATALDTAGTTLQMQWIESVPAADLTPDRMLDELASALTVAGTDLISEAAGLAAYPDFAGGDPGIQSAVVDELTELATGLRDAGVALDGRLFDVAAVQCDRAVGSAQRLGWEGYRSSPEDSLAARLDEFGTTLSHLGQLKGEVELDLAEAIAHGNMPWPDFVALVESQDSLLESPYSEYIALPNDGASDEILPDIELVYSGSAFQTFCSTVSQAPGSFIDEVWPIVAVLDVRAVGERLTTIASLIAAPESASASPGPAPIPLDDCPINCTNPHDPNCHFCEFVIGAARVSPKDVKKVKRSVRALSELLDIHSSLTTGVHGRAWLVTHVLVNEAIPASQGKAITAAATKIIAIGSKVNPGGWAKACWECCEFRRCWDWWPEGGYWLGLVTVKDASDIVEENSEWIAVPAPQVDPNSSMHNWALVVLHMQEGSARDRIHAMRTGLSAGAAAANSYCATASSTGLCN